MHTSTDLAALRAKVPLPDQFTEGRWAAKPLAELDMGPKDYRIVARFPQNGVVDAAMSSSNATATLVLSPEWRAALDLEAGEPVTGAAEPCEPYQNIFWRCTNVIRRGSDVFIEWHSK